MYLFLFIICRWIYQNWKQFIFSVSGITCRTWKNRCRISKIGMSRFLGSPCRLLGFDMSEYGYPLLASTSPSIYVVSGNFPFLALLFSSFFFFYFLRFLYIRLNSTLIKMASPAEAPTPTPTHRYCKACHHDQLLALFEGNRRPYKTSCIYRNRPIPSTLQA
jgi:hypothetical protein